MKTVPIVLAVALSLSSYAGTPKPAASSAPTASSSAAAKSKATSPTARTIVADVDGIVCAFCVQGIQKIFKSKGKAEEVFISLEMKKVFVTEKVGQTITDEEFRETIRHAGFKTQSITRSPLSIAEARARVANKQPLVTQATDKKTVHTAAR
jgi:hypothetical protein